MRTITSLIIMNACKSVKTSSFCCPRGQKETTCYIYFPRNWNEISKSAALVEDFVILGFHVTLRRPCSCTEQLRKKSWEFDSVIMQNVSDILPLFCTPTWPSHHVSENQEKFHISERSYQVLFII